jgi:uncharacterized metal-binding protein
MPSGRTHFFFESMVAIGLCVALVGVLLEPGTRAAFAQWVPLPAAVAFVVGYLFSLTALSPDLDLARSRSAFAWGPLRVLWWPYNALFKHRGLSHHWLWGTASRLVYLAVVIALPVAMGAAQLGWWDPATVDGTTLRPWMPAAAGFILGCYIPNLVHIFLDWLW